MLEVVTNAVAAAPPLSAPRSVAEPDVTSIVPPQPKTIRDTGLDRQLVLALLAKAIHQAGKAHLPILGSKLRLSLNVLREALELLMAEQVVEIASRGESDIDVQYRLTGPGKTYVAECLAQCRYVGPAPVTLDAFRVVLARDAARHAQAAHIGSAELAAAFADDGIGSAVRTQIGAALHSRRTLLLLHGPSGSGKSALARKLVRLLPGVVCVPYAILVGQHIVQFHDPLVHLAPLPNHAREHDERRNCDSRWSVCQRPLVQVGAELTREMLDLRYDAANGIYRVPCHFQASGGVCVIDDLGRQRLAASDLLNHFIAPLDRGTTLLTLQGGHTEPVPFDVKLVLVSNLAPQAMFDEPLLRRIGYKIHLGALSEAAYRALLRRECASAGIAFEQDAADYLLKQLHAASVRPLLAAYPRELLSRVADFASFAGTPPRLTIPALEQAWTSMFVCCAPLAGNPAVAASAQAAVLFGERS